MNEDPEMTLAALRTSYEADGWRFLCDAETGHYFALRETSETGREVAHAPTARELAAKLEAAREH